MYNKTIDDVKAEETTVGFISITTVYGGNAGINLLFKNKLCIRFMYGKIVNNRYYQWNY